MSFFVCLFVCLFLFCFVLFFFSYLKSSLWITQDTEKQILKTLIFHEPDVVKAYLGWCNKLKRFFHFFIMKFLDYDARDTTMCCLYNVHLLPFVK